MLCPEAKDKDGPASRAPDSRSNYEHIWLVGTFDRFLKNMIEWGRREILSRLPSSAYSLHSGTGRTGICILEVCAVITPFAFPSYLCYRGCILLNSLFSSVIHTNEMQRSYCFCTRLTSNERNPSSALKAFLFKVFCFFPATTKQLMFFLKQVTYGSCNLRNDTKKHCFTWA